MRVAVLYFGGGSASLVADVSRAIADTLSRRNFQVDLIDGSVASDARLTAYGFIVVGTASVSTFGGKIDARIGERLGQMGTLVGKKAFAFVVQRPFGTTRALLRLMSRLEHEGMFVRSSDTIRSSSEARAVAERLKVDA